MNSNFNDGQHNRLHQHPQLKTETLETRNSTDPLDLQIDHVLVALGSATPRAGLEQSIAATLATRSAELQQQDAPASRRWLAPWALSLQAAFMLLIVLLLTHPHRPTSTTTQIAQNRVPIAHNVIVPSTAPTHTIVTPAAAHLRSAIPKQEAMLARPEAVSFPAPPLPLTQQEQLLIRLAQRNNPAQLAPLIPAKREAQEAIEIAEFHAYFPPDHKEIPQ